MPNRVVHFEIEASDPDRAKKFYTDAFGWEMEQTGPEMSNYIVVKTGDPKEAGGINGGIFKSLSDSKEVNAYSCVVGVDNIDQAIEKIKSSGGLVTTDKMDIPGVGTFAKCKDTEGNIFSILQGAEMESK